MAFENLSERLQNTIAKLTGKGKVSEADVKEMMREVRLALLEADVNFKVVKDFVKKISERAVGTEVMKSLTPAQQIVKIVNEELVELLGGTNVELNQGGKITTTMMVGLQGAGKTTTAGKLALKVKKTMKKKPLLIAADVYRPAAVQQLKTLGKQLDIEVFYVDKDPVDIVKEGLEFAREHYYNYVIIDTAGRLHIDELLMDELKDIKYLKFYGNFEKPKTAIVALNFKGIPSGDIAEVLAEEYDIAVRAGTHCAPLIHEHFGTKKQGIVRFSFSSMNTEEEVDYAVNAVKRIAENI